jgi:hypothetical protein
VQRSTLSPVASLHRSQISENFDLEDYLIDSGSGSRIRPRDGGADSAAFSEREFSNRLFPILLFGNLLLNGREAAV